MTDARYIKVDGRYVKTPVTYPHLPHMKVLHQFQCKWRVTKVKDGHVTWRCWCGRTQDRQVRVYGILPVQYLNVRRSQWQSALSSTS